MAKKKGSRYTPPKQEARCDQRSFHARRPLPHLFTSRRRSAPKTNATNVIAEMTHGEPGPWTYFCSYCMTRKP